MTITRERLWRESKPFVGPAAIVIGYAIVRLVFGAVAGSRGMLTPAGSLDSVQAALGRRRWTADLRDRHCRIRGGVSRRDANSPRLGRARRPGIVEQPGLEVRARGIAPSCARGDQAPLCAVCLLPGAQPVDKARELGMDWWVRNPDFASGAVRDAELSELRRQMVEIGELRRQIAGLEAAQRAK